MNPAPMIIALSGAASAGKSTAAAYLADRHGFARVRFAGPLKAMVRAFLSSAGTPAEDIERLVEGDLKEAPAAAFAGNSPRYFMQALGTEFGRQLIHPDLWVAAWSSGASSALGAGAPGVVVEDCRFANEAEAVRALAGRIVRIERPGAVIPLSGHPSEGQAFPCDATVRNDDAPEILHQRLDALVQRFRLRLV